MVNVANIIITKSLDVVNKIFFSENKLTSLSEKALLLTSDDLKDSLIFGPGNPSKGLLNFEYHYGKAGSTSVRVDFIETAELAEFLLLGNDPMARLLESKISRDPGLADEIEETITRESFVESREPTYSESEDVLKNSNKFYFAFGTSDDIREWAGPYSMSMMRAVLKNTEDNVRTIEAVFIPNPTTHKSWTKNFEKLYGYSEIVDDYNDSVVRGSYIAAEGSVRTSVDINLAGPDIVNTWVRDVMKDYLANACETKNVVVCLPNDVSVQKQKETTSKYIMGPRPRFNTNNEAVLKQLGFKISPFVEYYDLSIDSKGTVTQTPSKKSSSFDRTSENTVKNIAVTKWDISMEMREPIGKAGRPKTPILQPLYKMCASIGSVSKDARSQDFTLFEETDVKLLRLWKKYGIIGDASKPALIYGDGNSIRRLLYLGWYAGPTSNPTGISSINRDYLFNSGKNVQRFNTLRRAETQESFTSLERLKSEDSNVEYTEYAADFANEFNLDLKSDSAFFNNSEVSTGVKDLAASLRLKDLAKSDLIFRHNMSFPNVLELNYKVEGYLAALMNLNVFPRIPLDNINSTTKSATRDILYKTLDYNFFFKIIDTVDPTGELSDTKFALKLSSNTALQEQIFRSPSVIRALTENPEFADTVTDMNIVAYISFIRYLELQKTRDTGKNVGIGILSDSERYDKVYEAMYSNLESIMVRASIKTLPYFNRNIYMKKQCSLIGVNNSIIGAESSKRLAPYTGEYEVIGWSHIISTDSIHSEFELVRSGTEGNTSDLTGEKVKSRVIKYLLSEKDRLSRKDYFGSILDDLTEGNSLLGNMELNKVNELLNKLGG